MSEQTYDYDYVVIGGGSGGMASAKEAARHGAKVALFDFVKPSTQGTRWGLGGTCVNVGCVPKKLMHYAGLLGAGLHDARHFGWVLPEDVKHNWATLVEAVQAHVKSLNWGYKTGLRSAQVTYINALATLKSAHEITYEEKKKGTVTLTAKYILIAVGGRPHIPEEVPGAVELAITSDDIFSYGKVPGKTLVVGGSYIALECAGFLHEVGFDTTVCVRSIVLRGFDRQCSEKVAALEAEIGIKFKWAVLPSKMTRVDEETIEVTFTDGAVERFNTVLYATGRNPDTKAIGLEAVGVNVLPSGKLHTVNEQTNVPSIFAVGDVLEGKLELTPVAIQAGELLARRLFAGATATMNYDLVPTTVFTPFEYGCCGLSEEDAVARYGADNVEVYLFEFTSLELSAAHRNKAPHMRADEADLGMSPTCLSKLVCLKSENERVVGFHYVGPNAGEVTQGFALAVRLGATKKDFGSVVGIHPTDAESFTTLEITRASGESWVAAGGCGGGKCG